MAHAEPVIDLNIIIEAANKNVDQYADGLIETFKDIHADPELTFNEVRTADIIEKDQKPWL